MSTTTAKHPAKITICWLRKHDACEEQLQKFEVEWPDGAPFTAESLRRAAEIHLDLDWFAKSYLSAPAWAEYKRVNDTALAEYERVRAELLIQILEL